MLDLLDALIIRINAIWGVAKGADDVVAREYVASVDLKSFIGRHVYLFPLGWEDQRENRVESLIPWTTQIQIIERYTAQGKPTKSWIDTRVNFVASIQNALTYRHSLLSVGNREIWTETATVDLYDPELLEQTKTFFSIIDLEFRELQ